MKQMRIGKSTTIVAVLFVFTWNSNAQTIKTLSLQETFKLALTNSKQLKVSQTGADIAQSVVKQSQTALTPNIDVSLSEFYIGNGWISDRDFSNSQTVSMPHWGTNFGIEASQVIFAGGAVSQSIQKTKLEAQVAQLAHEKNELDIYFLVTGFYLELYKLKNQAEVIQKNIEQTDLLITQIKQKENQGMALSNDVTRHELLLQNLRLSLIEVDNARKIINNQLVTTLGLPADTEIRPDKSILDLDLSKVNRDNLFTQAFTELPELKTAALNKKIAEKELRIAKADYYPQLALFATNSFTAPILIEVPTIDKNFNFWCIGLGVKYNLASLYKSNSKLQIAHQKIQLATNTEALAKEQTQIAVENAYIRFHESIEKLSVYETADRVAEENYRIINNRYLSDLVLITEMLDASNTKLNAELQLVNAKLTVIFNYYKLQREIGSKQN